MSSFRSTLSMGIRGLKNYILKKPFCVSFEVTYGCNARCKHCHLGGTIPNEKRATSEEYAAIFKKLKPVVAQFSGGEPLMRKDLEQIISGIKRKNRYPFIILTTNAALLTKKRYDSLREAGVDEFSISLDYPDERHDDFRTIPGLFKKIEKFLSEIKDVPNKGVTLSGVVHRQNYRELNKMADFARKWDVGMNFSTYTWLRTNKKDDFLITEDEMPEFKEKIKEILAYKKQYKTVFTSEYNLSKMIEFFEKQYIGNCRAGERFCIVGPDGMLSPCGLILEKYKTQKEMRKKFTKTNKCGACFTSIRGNSEKTPVKLIKDNLAKVFGK